MADPVTLNFQAQPRVTLFNNRLSQFTSPLLSVVRPSGSAGWNDKTNTVEAVATNTVEPDGVLCPGTTTLLLHSADFSQTWTLGSTPTTTTGSKTSVYPTGVVADSTLNSTTSVTVLDQTITSSIASASYLFVSAIVEYTPGYPVNLSVKDTINTLATVQINPFTTGGVNSDNGAMVQLASSGPNNAPVYRFWVRAKTVNAISSTNGLTVSLEATPSATTQTLITHSVNAYTDYLGPPVATDASQDIYKETNITTSNIPEVTNEGGWVIDVTPYAGDNLTSRVMALWPTLPTDTTTFPSGGVNLQLVNRVPTLTFTDASGATQTLSTSAIPFVQETRIVIVYSSINNAIYLIDSYNNTEVSLTGTIPSNLSAFQLGHPFIGRIPSVRYFPIFTSTKELI